MRRPWTMRVLEIALAGTFAATGCGVDTGTDAAGGNGGTPACAPGESKACVGPGACQGGQQCLANGSGFAACDCGSDAGGAAGAGQGGSGGTGGAAATGGTSNTGGTGGTNTGGAAGSGGLVDGGLDAAADPCAGISPLGTCTATNTVKYCFVPTGQGEAQIVALSCSAFESCTVESGVAACRAKPGNCEPGENECLSVSTARYCNAAGQWISYSCAQCSNSALGALCPGSMSTKGWAGYVKYEARGPNSSYSGWSSTYTAVGQSLLVMSYIYDNATSTYTAIDAVVTGASGDFSIKVPTAPGPNDVVTVWAIHPSGTGAGIDLAVAKPDVTDGKIKVYAPIPADTSEFWSWSSMSNSLGSSGGTITIPESYGSGALRLFDWARYVRASAVAMTGKPPLSLVLWMRNNTAWDCGACALNAPASVKTYEFASQIWIPALAQDTSYWSDAVTTHELGHWLMSSYGTSPFEGGKHLLGCTTFPGQAWSEGFATWASSLSRTSPIYYDKQSGSFFKFDIAQRTGTTWPMPTPSLGLLQPMYENEVAAELWTLADHTEPAMTQPKNAVFFTALQSAAMNKPSGVPYGRGYTWHTWDLGTGCAKTNETDIGTPVPMYADFLDALRCAGMPATTVDLATQPTTRYPYPSAAPICN